MNHKWLLSTALGCSALTLLQAADLMTGPKPLYADRFDFEEKPCFQAWPRENQSDLSLVDGASGKALRVAPTKAALAIYQSMALPVHGPGMLSVSFDYKMVNPATKADVQINFNLEGKGNGSAGRTTIPLNPAAEWTHFHKILIVQDKVAALQYTFNIAGANAEILFDNYVISYSPDTVTVPFAEKEVYFNDPATGWCWNPRNVTYGMFTFDQVANTPSQMQVAADNKGLYFLFHNFENPKQIKTSVTEHDGAVWKDSANELILFDDARGTGWQFIITAKGTTFEGKLGQRVPGDPWTCNTEWNGEWKGAGKVTENGFETRFFIPWATIGVDPAAGADLGFNAAGDYPATNEYPCFNSYRGTRLTVGKFGRLTVADNKLTVTRARDVEKLTYTIDRPNAKFETLLEKGTKGNYPMDVWSMGINRGDFPKAMESKYSDEEFNAWQDELLRAWGVARIGGPSWPWVTKYGDARMKARFEKDGLKYPLFISNSDYGRKARKLGAKFLDPRNDFTVDSVDPCYVQAIEEGLLNLPQNSRYEFMKASTKFVLGIDEPTNSPEQCYNPAFNKANVPAIEELSRKIKAEYGFGKYGVPFLNGVPEQDVPFARIAFYRWWNNELKKANERYIAAAAKTLPGVPFNLLDDNNTAGQSMLDAALQNGMGDSVSTDPYPTATNAYYGMSRAIYHVGYSCRVLGDLMNKSKLLLMPQAFIYHGAHGDLAAMREWCSQGMKNGAVALMWFCTDAVHNIFDDYAGMLELSAMINRMDKLVLPTETKTLVWYSNFDKWAKDDRATHAAYSVYAMLEEVLGSNFRFISDTTLTMGDVKLADYKLMYVPAMSYSTPEIAAKLTEWVKNGGTMVVFDPLFMEYNIDGSKLAKERAALTGQTGEPAVKTSANTEIKWNGKTLPVAMIANAPSLPGSRFASYTMDAGKDKVLMTYPDDAPAAIEHKVGTGKVIYFAVQPFAGSDLVTRFGDWKAFFEGEAKAIGEKTDLPIRDFLLPDPPKVVNLKRMIK